MSSLCPQLLLPPPHPVTRLQVSGRKSSRDSWPQGGCPPLLESRHRSPWCWCWGRVPKGPFGVSRCTSNSKGGGGLRFLGTGQGAAVLPRGDSRERGRPEPNVRWWPWCPMAPEPRGGWSRCGSGRCQGGARPRGARCLPRSSARTRPNLPRDAAGSPWPRGEGSAPPLPPSPLSLLPSRPSLLLLRLLPLAPPPRSPRPPPLPVGGGAAAPARSGPSSATQRPVSMAAARAGAQRRSRPGRHRASAADVQVPRWGYRDHGAPAWVGGLRRQRRSVPVCAVWARGPRAAAAPRAAIGPRLPSVCPRLFQVAGEARGARAGGGRFGPGPAEGPQPGSAPSGPLGPLLVPDPPSPPMPPTSPGTEIRGQGCNCPRCARARGPPPTCPHPSSSSGVAEPRLPQGAGPAVRA